MGNNKNDKAKKRQNQKQHNKRQNKSTEKANTQMHRCQAFYFVGPERSRLFSGGLLAPSAGHRPSAVRGAVLGGVERSTGFWKTGALLGRPEFRRTLRGHEFVGQMWPADGRWACELLWCLEALDTVRIKMCGPLKRSVPFYSACTFQTKNSWNLHGSKRGTGHDEKSLNITTRPPSRLEGPKML